MTTPRKPAKAASKPAAKNPEAPAALKPLHRQVAEALRESGVEPVTVLYGGNRYTFPAALDDVSGDAFDAIAAGNVAAALPQLLGPEELSAALRFKQWELFKSTKPKRPQYVELFQKWNLSGGTDSGE